MKSQNTSEPIFARCSAVLTDTRPLFTHDSKYLVCAAGRSVRFYGVLSGEIVHQVNVHTGNVTGITVAPHNSRQLVTCGLDGRLVFIDASDGQVLRELKCKYPIYGVYFCGSAEEGHLRLLLLSKRGKSSELRAEVQTAEETPVKVDSGKQLSDYQKCHAEQVQSAAYDCSLHLFDLDLTSNELTQVSDLPLFTEVSRDATRTCVAKDGAYVVTVRRQKMTVRLLSRGDNAPELGQKEKNSIQRNNTFVYHVPIAHRAHSEVSFECVTVHPSERSCVVTGLSDGRIILWWNVAEHEQDKSDRLDLRVSAEHDPLHSKNRDVSKLGLAKRQSAKTATLHWHALPVGAVTYTPDGAFLLSGGLECVLVKWYQPETGRQSFLPRLGARIQSISVSADGAFYAVVHHDNALSVVQASVNGVVQSVQGLVSAHRFNRRLKAENFIMPAGLHRDPANGSLVLNGRVGLLQFYDPRIDRCTFQLDVVGENLISPENIDDPNAQTWLTEVACFAFSPRGRWLATAESLIRSLIREQRNETGYCEVRLKFWRLRVDNNFELVTCVDMPHVGDVQALRFGSTEDLFGSVSEDDSRLTLASCGAQDGQLRLWRLQSEQDDALDNTVSWQAVASATYREAHRVSSCDFSADASLLAAVFDGDAVLLRTEARFGRLELLAALDSSFGPVRSVHLFARTWSHLLVAHSKSLRVYDVLDCSCVWNFDLIDTNEITLCVFDKISSRCAIVDRQNDVIAFDCDSRSMLFRKQIPQSVSNKQPLSAVFDNEPNTIRIYFATMDSTVCSIEHRLQSDCESAMETDSTILAKRWDDADQTEVKSKTPFELFVASHLRSVNAEQRKLMIHDRKLNANDERNYDTVVGQFVSAPSHTLPNAAVMCHSLFSAALRLRPAESN